MASRNCTVKITFNECLMVSAWAADFIAPAILSIALRYNKSNKPENHKSILFIMFL